MKVSIITPTYNSIKYIDQVVNCILSQTFTDWEWIIVDDCSSDGTKDYLKSLDKEHSNIHCFYNKTNLGAGPARNLAIENANGEYIAFIDSDDLWTLDKLEKQIHFMDENDSVMSHTSYGFIDQNGESIRTVFEVSDHPVSYENLLKNTEISCLGAIYSQKKLGKRYMPDIRRKQDYALWLSILKDGHCSDPIKESLAFYRQHKDSATSKKYKLILKHCLFLHNNEGLSWIKSLYCTFWWGYNGIIKYYLKK